MIGPYVVTVKLRCDQAACGRMEPCEAERSGWCAHPNAEDGFGRRVPIQRRAVATLDEAEAVVRSMGCDQFSESGGTASLPDGTLIEVEATNWTDLAEPYTPESFMGKAEILAAFNEAQGEEAGGAR